MKRRIVGSLIVCAATARGQSVASRVTSPSDRELITALVAIEDARDTVILGNDVRRRGLASPNPFVRAFAVRGLGRLERAALVDVIAPSLQDSSAEVRAAAADALAQSVARGGEPLARERLVARFDGERDPTARAMLLESIGRLRQGSVDHVQATAMAIAPDLAAPAPIRHGAIRGLFFLSQRPEARTAGAIPPSVADRAFSVLTSNDPGLSSEDRLNLAAMLVNSGAVDAQRIEWMATSGDPYVRDRALTALLRFPDTALARKIFNSASGDGSAIVRYRAVTLYARRLRASSCAILVTMTHDRDMTVALVSIDALAGCRGDTVAVSALDRFASSALTSERWHAPAHALVALASLDPMRARALFPRFETSTDLFVRMYADSAARILRDTAALYRLARDAHPNVRSSAIAALSALVGHAADSVYIAALASDDNQLLMAASAALKGASKDSAEVVAALSRAWNRLSSSGRETARDGLRAIRERFIERGGRIADLGARDVQRVTTPTFDDLAAFERLTATIEMADGSVIDFKLHPFEAPTNVARFVRLAKAGTFDGLTFHRIAPFFVVQGPSPNANEYSAPDGPFTRDELGHSNLRGTIGLSTRGRDTGDGQFYINTVDNIRLDHDYTVMGTITRDLEAFDRMQEGAKIRRIYVK